MHAYTGSSFVKEDMASGLLDPWQYGWPPWECPVGMWMGPYEYACVHSYMPWLTPMQMGPWPMEPQLTPWNSGCADDTNENTDARKIEKRTEALASIKNKTDFPWLGLDVREHPIAPNPHDLTITKRQWEKAMMKYRHELIARAKEFLRRNSHQSEASNEKNV